MGIDEEIKEILNCIASFDSTETLKTKGRYFNEIQKDVRALIKKNRWTKKDIKTL